MSSFETNEPQFRWPKISSVLDDWNEKRNDRRRWSSTVFGSFCDFDTEVYNDRTLPWRRKSMWDPDGDWPFNWDWNELFTHDFPLLDLPSTVLSQLMKTVDRDDRIALSHANRKLRNLLVKNKSPNMDRRKTIKYASIDMYEWTTQLKMYWDGKMTNHDSMVFENVESLKEYAREMRPRYFIQKLAIAFVGNHTENGDFSRIMEAVDGFAGQILGSCDLDTSEPLATMIDSFIKYPHVREITIHKGHRKGISTKWDEYCTTVASWAEANGTEVERTNYGKFPTLYKWFLNGKMEIVIFEGTPRRKG